VAGGGAGVGAPALAQGRDCAAQAQGLLRVRRAVGLAKANGCPWGVPNRFGSMKNSCAIAAEGGHLETLQWAREHGCRWGEWR
jgi:hypothetical protein